jgi:hypothetical protein
MRTLLTLFVIIVALSLIGCTPLMLRPADFSWPIEVVGKPDSKGMVQEARYQVAFNVKALLFAEFQDSVNVTKHSLRIIRDHDGFYFITGKAFKNIYVFGSGDGALKLEKKILISEKGLEAPAFNQKKPFIQLINENKEDEAPVNLTKDGVQEGAKK